MMASARSAISSPAGGGQVRLLEREAVDVAVEQRVGVGGHLHREPAATQAAEHGIVMARASRARGWSGTP